MNNPIIKKLFETPARVSVVFCTLLVTICGLGCMINWAVAMNYPYSELNIGLWNMEIFMLVSGLFLAFVTPLMIVGILKTNKLALMIYCIIIAILCCLQVAVACVGFVNRANVDGKVPDAWIDAYTNDPSVITSIENTYGCCGLTGPTDYNIGCNETDSKYGCEHMVSCLGEDHALSVSVSAMAMIILESFTAMFPVFLWKKMKNGEK